MLGPKKIGTGVEGYSSAVQDSLESNFRLYDKVVPVLDNLLSIRVQKFSNKKHTNMLVAAAMFFCSGISLSAFTFRSGVRSPV